MKRTLLLLFFLAAMAVPVLAGEPPARDKEPASVGDPDNGGHGGAPVMVISTIQKPPVLSPENDPLIDNPIDLSPGFFQEISIEYVTRGNNNYIQVACGNGTSISFVELYNEVSGEYACSNGVQGGTARVPVSGCAGRWRIVITTASGNYLSGRFDVNRW